MQGISNGSTPADPAVVTRALTRKFGGFFALQDVNLEVPAGALLGLLGPNGSGKTTLLSILAGFISPTSGSFRLLGMPDHRQALTRTGSLISRPLLWPHLSCRDNLRCILGMLGLDSGRSSVDSLLAQVGLEGNSASRKFSQCSTGMKQRLGIATALVGDPDLLLLDEPTTGLDPEGMVEIRDLVRTLGREGGRTVIMSSHLLHEVELTCDSYAIIHKGNLVDQGDISDTEAVAAVVRIETTDNATALNCLKRNEWSVQSVSGESEIAESLLVEATPGREWEVARDLAREGIYPLSMGPVARNPGAGSLEQKYLAAVGRAGHPEEDPR
ncbi:MAG: ABC transporter ATP-binding protein [Chloroflexota bacterium]|nr:ABC transporter ATP-binding protein [Chloroflexota bacterium]